MGLSVYSLHPENVNPAKERQAVHSLLAKDNSSPPLMCHLWKEYFKAFESCSNSKLSNLTFKKIFSGNTE